MSMYHTKTPDENGWYWVRLRYGEIGLCRFDPEDDDDHIWMINTAGKSMFEWDSGDVHAWIGPLPCPFGDMASDGAYFAEDQYQEAINDKTALMMTLVDGGGDDRSFGTVIGVYQMPLDEALDKTGGMMRTIDRKPE